MYKCKNCGHLFENGEEDTFEEPHPYGMGVATEIFFVCPLCKGGYEEIEPCKICGSYYHNVDEKYCDNCKESVKKRFTDFVEKEFTKEERELLNELYDGEEI